MSLYPFSDMARDLTKHTIDAGVEVETLTNTWANTGAFPTWNEVLAKTTYIRQSMERMLEEAYKLEVRAFSIWYCRSKDQYVTTDIENHPFQFEQLCVVDMNEDEGLACVSPLGTSISHWMPVLYLRAWVAPVEIEVERV